MSSEEEVWDWDVPGRSAQSPTACDHAETGTRAWREAGSRQAFAPSRHEDFYTLAGEVTETLQALDYLAGSLVRQVENYGTGREIYDDTRDTPGAVNPYERLQTAAEHLRELRGHLAGADRAANDYWSSISHIGVEYHDQIEDQVDGQLGD